MTNQKKPAIAIETPDQVSKLEGCVIRKARMGPGNAVILDVTHSVVSPDPVRIVFKPEAKIEFAQAQLGGGYPPIIVPVMGILSMDIPTDKQEPL